MAESVDIGAAIRAVLLADSTLSGLVGDRIYTDFVPQSAGSPSVVYHVISEVATDCLEGPPVGVDQTRIQVEGISNTSRGESVRVRNAFRDVLAGLSDVVDGVQLKVAQATGAYYFFDRAESGTDQHRFRTIQDFFVSYHSLAKVS